MIITKRIKSLKYIREKTKNSTKDNLQEIEFMITEDIQRIIDKWSSKPLKSSSFIFNILDPDNLTEKGRRNAFKNATKRIGKYMKRIATELALEKMPTYFFARHSFSTILKRAGVPIEMISEQLGHLSIFCQRHYSCRNIIIIIMSTVELNSKSIFPSLLRPKR